MRYSIRARRKQKFDTVHRLNLSMDEIESVLEGIPSPSIFVRVAGQTSYPVAENAAYRTFSSSLNAEQRRRFEENLNDFFRKKSPCGGFAFEDTTVWGLFFGQFQWALLTVVPTQSNLREQKLLLANLTPREREITLKSLEGGTIRSIACSCGVSEGTVKKTLSHVYEKLGISGKYELLLFCSSDL